MSDTLYDYVDTTGLIVPDTSTLLGEIQDEFTTALPGIPLAASTPQGVLITAETLARASVVQNNATVANQINPNYAGGVFLDAICALTGLSRSANSFTTVASVILAGQPGVPIPAGAMAVTTANDQFTLDAAVTLDPATGLATGSFTAVQPGPVPCGAGSLGLTGIATDVLGWETVSSPVAGILGTIGQQDEPLRALRRNTLALQGVALIEAILSAISDIPGVIGRQGLENYTNATATIEGISLVANSIWVCVDGGTALQIATALLANKSMGANWNGAQSLSVLEPMSGQTYLVKWDVPTLVPVLVRITCKQASFVGDLTAAATQAVVDFGNNAVEGIPGFSVGESASPFEIAGAVMQECPGIYIQKVELALASSGTYAVSEIAMALNQKATVTYTEVTIVIVT